MSQRVFSAAQLAADAELERSQVAVLTREGVLQPLPDFKHPGRGASRVYGWSEAVVARVSAQMIKRFNIPIRSLLQLSSILRPILQAPDTYDVHNIAEARAIRHAVSLRRDPRYDRQGILDSVSSEFGLDKTRAADIVRRAKSLKPGESVELDYWADIEEARQDKKMHFIWLRSTHEGVGGFSLRSVESMKTAHYDPVAVVIDVGSLLQGL